MISLLYFIQIPFVLFLLPKSFDRDFFTLSWPLQLSTIAVALIIPFIAWIIIVGKWTIKHWDLLIDNFDQPDLQKKKRVKSTDKNRVW